jgi:membrane-associated phospholipid phosphatase
MSPRQAFWACIGLLAVASAACIAWVDQPVALYFNTSQALRPLFQACAAPSLAALPLAGLFLLWSVWRRLRGAGGTSGPWLAMSLATLASTAAKDELKWVFGRPWPGTWLKYGNYSFHPFVESIFFGAFPSGHTAYVSAPLAVLWVLLPRWRLAAGAVTGLVMLGLVGADYHFVSDVLAGLITGLLSAWGTLVLMAPRRG